MAKQKTVRRATGCTGCSDAPSDFQRTSTGQWLTERQNQ